MKVILLRDVAKLGKRNTVVEVPDGFALNKLIPSQSALPATPANMKRLNAKTTHDVSVVEDRQKAFAEAVAKLATTPVAITVEANEQGHLFKGIKESDIASALVSSGVIGIPLESIKLAEPIKSCGEHQINLTLGGKAGSMIISINAKK